MVETVGWFAIGCTCLLLLWGVFALIGKTTWWVRWKWGDANQLARSVQLGWNTGEPPDGEWIMVREYCGNLESAGRKIDRDQQWRVMKVADGWCHSASGGFSMPVTNVTGWLKVIEGNG